LVYLRGRTCTNDAEALTFFERARALDPANPFPNYALGYHHLTAGDWAQARPLLARACELRPDDDSFHYWLWLTQLALGEFTSLEQDLRDRLRRNPIDIYSAVQLAQVLIAAGKEKEATRLASEFDRAAFARSGNSGTRLTRAMHRTLLYISGDFAALEKFARTDNTTAARSALFHSVVEQGRLAEAEKLLTNDEFNL